MVRSEFERDAGALRGLLKSKDCEKDPYKGIILVERYILKYGMATTKKTVKTLLSGISKIDQLEILLDVMQDKKTHEELTINIKKYG